MTFLSTCSYRAFHPSMGQPVICSLTHPKDLAFLADAPTCHLLTPRWSYFRSPDAGEQFEAQLARFGVQKVAGVLHKMAREYVADRLVLLCWEANWDDCHRQRIARWLLDEAGELVTELTVPPVRQQLAEAGSTPATRRRKAPPLIATVHSPMLEDM